MDVSNIPIVFTFSCVLNLGYWITSCHSLLYFCKSQVLDVYSLIAGIPCAEDEYVSLNTCMPCAAGTTNQASDDASGDDTVCDGQFFVSRLAFVYKRAYLMVTSFLNVCPHWFSKCN